MDGPEEMICILESCRLCLRGQGMYNIFRIEGLMRDIYEFLGIKVYFSGRLPQKICSECMDILYKIKQLRRIASNSDIHIRSYLNSTFEPSKIDDQIERAITQQNSDRLNITETISTDEQVESYIIKCEDLTIDEDCFLDSDISQDKEPGVNVATLHEEGPCLEDDPFGDIDANTDDSLPETPKIIVRNDLFKSSSDEPSTTTKKRLKEKLIKLDDGTLKEEVNVKTENVKSEYICGVCQKIFHTWKKVYLHSRIHNKSITCPLEGCEKMFATKGDLVKHTRTHTGEKPFTCDICSRRFSQKVTLRHHKISVHRIVPDIIVGT